MIELLIGTKGTGKTKVLIQNVNDASASADGNVVFISNNMKILLKILCWHIWNPMLHQLLNLFRRFFSSQLLKKFC